jgi:type VI secretion system secreted protein Hcp
MLKKLVAGSLALALAISTTTADAAMMAYLRLKGARSGEVKGSVTQKGREGMIGVIAASHEIVSPRDPASGQASGKRMHKPLVITKELDKSSPILYRMLTTNENIPELELRFYHQAAAGMEMQFYTVKLTNASISQIHFVQANVRQPELARLEEYEEVSFTYQKIEWTWNEGGITAQDDWMARM